MADISKALKVVRKLSPSGFFSRAAEAAQEIPQAKGTPEQMRKMLLDRKGVKPEELRWTGFDEWAKGKKSVTRDEITEFLRRNEVQVGERTLGSRDAQHGKFTLPGGENYRELLLTRQMPPAYSVKATESGNFILIDNATGKPARTANGQMVPPFSSERQATEVAQTYSRALGNEKMRQTGYRSSHWDEPNPIAHMRMKERVDPEGRRVLHLEEAQSDWAQQGRLVGFYTDEASAAANRERNAARQTQIQDEVRRILNGRKSTELSPEELRPIQKLVDENLLLNKHPQGVPSAPFVESTPGWTNFALRRAMIEAARRNYDAIAWTPGREQAARYPGGGAAREAGMSGYYDKILPTQISKVLKDIGETPQFGNVSFTRGNVRASGDDIMNALPETRAMNEAQRSEWWRSLDPQRHEQLFQEYRTRPMKLPSFNITPEMREKINQGLPLFTMMPAAIGLGAAQMQERAPVEGANPAVEPQTTEPERREFQGGGRTEMTPEEYNRALEAAKDVLRQQLREQISAANANPPKMTNRVPPQRVPPLGAPIAVGPGRIGEEPAPSEPAAPTVYAPVAAPAAARQESPVERAMAVVRNVPRAAYEMVASPVATAQNVAKEIFSGDNYQSTGEPVTSNGRVNWGDPDSAADFFRADAALQELRPYREEGFADGGHVEHALRLIQDEYPTQYLPNVGRQVMADGGSTMEGFMPPTPDETPDDRGERWQAALRNYRNFPVRPGEATLKPADISARDYFAQAIAGEGGPSYGSELRKRAANLLVGSRGLPDTGIGFGVADAPMITGIPLQALDIADATRRGDYGEAALGAALPVAFWARKPLMSAGRRAVEVAGDVLGRVPAPVAAGAAGAAVMTPQEAEASPAKALVRATKKTLAPAVEERPPLFDYSRLGDVPHVRQFDLPRNEPPRGVPTRVLDMINNQAVREEMLKTIEQGNRMGGSRWYNADPLREKFVEQFGLDRGEEAFRKYMDFVAATSPRSEVGANVRNASYYYNRAMTGQGMPAVGDRNPQPYGHMAQRLHQINAERVSGTGWDPLNNPKPASFVENLVGNQRPVTVDTHAFRLPAIIARDPRFLETAFQVDKTAPKQNIAKMIESGEISMDDAANRAAYWQAQPKANEYAAVERYYKSLGQDLGLTPAQTQAAAWVGGGARTGLKSDESKPFLRFVEDRIYKTAIERNMDPQDVMRLFVRGEMPLYANGGPVEERDGYAGGSAVVSKALRAIRELMEGAKDLPEKERMMVVHKTRPSSLELYETLGGMPAPSTAVIKPSEPLTSFGSITLVGDPEKLAIPGARNPIFASDAYTPRMPEIFFKNDKPYFNVYNKYGEPSTRRATIQSILRQMKSSGTIRGGENFGGSEGSIRARITPEFKNVNELAAARSRLSSDAYQEATFRSNYGDIYRRMREASLWKESDPGTDLETVASIARRYGGLDPRSVMGELGRNYTIDKDLASGVANYLKGLRDMPAPYFEGKPQRVVPLSDFSGALIPEGRGSRNVADILNRQGVKNIEFYSPKQDIGDSAAKDQLYHTLIERFPNQQFADGGPVEE